MFKRSTESLSRDELLADRFRRLRERCGSRDDMAKRLGCSVALIKAYEEGTKSIPLRVILALGNEGADFLDELASELRESESIIPPDDVDQVVDQVTDASGGLLRSVARANADRHVDMAEAAGVHDYGARLERTGRRIRVGAARHMHALKSSTREVRPTERATFRNIG